MPQLPRVGERFGRYRIDSQIGRGGMGVVFGATDLSFDRTVALKVVAASLGDSPDFQQRFQREASVLARLDSPHVIAIFDYGVEDDCPYIATQYVGGGDLGGLIRARGPMPPRLALQVCAQVADALYDAHRVGVVHRDVKPGNVLLRDADAAEPHAYLCDFGIARTEADGLTAPGSVAGTWSYLSPECGRGQPGTPSSDVYALGCLLWVTLTGRPPYTGSDIEVAVAHQEAPVPQVVEAGPDDEAGRLLNAVLARALAKDPRHRFADADEFRTAMLAAAAVSASSAGVTPVPFTGPGSGAPRPPGASGVGPVSGSGPRPVPGSRSGSSSGSVSAPPFSPLAPPPRRRRAPLVVGVGIAVLVAAGIVAIVVSRHGGGSGPAPVAESQTQTAQTTQTAPPTPTAASGPVTGDTDGDGLGDFRMVYHYYVKDTDAADGQQQRFETHVWTSDGSSFTDGPTTTDDGRVSATVRLYAGMTGDFDGDGTPERLEVRVDSTKPGRYHVVGTTSGGHDVDTTWTIPTKYIATFVPADVDGDGDADVLMRYYDAGRDFTKKPSHISMATNAGDGDLGPVRGVVTYPTSPLSAQYVVGDYDGDGRADLAELVDRGETAQFDHKYRLTFLMGTGTSFTAGPQETYRASELHPLALSPDLDGDGDDELLLVEVDHQIPLQVFDLRDGAIVGPTQEGTVPGALARDDIATAARVTDVNGDGRDDVALITEVNDHHAAIRVAISDGTHLVPSKWASWDHDFAASVSTPLFDTGSDEL